MEEIYKKLRDKHDLPEFSLLDQEFEISSIEEETFPLRNIRKKIAEKAEFAIKLLDDILHPDPGFSSYKEAGIFDDHDREKIVEIYRRIMFFNRLSTELSFTDSDDLNAKFINGFIKEWPELKGDMLSFVRRMKDHWHKDISKKEIVGYLG